MVVIRVGANKQMEEEHATIRSKLEDLDQKFLALNRHHSPMDNRCQRESSANTGSECFATTVGRIWIFLTSMVMIQLDGFIG